MKKWNWEKVVKGIARGSAFIMSINLIRTPDLPILLDFATGIFIFFCAYLGWEDK